MILTPFDPWKSPMCVCPQKLSLNPYTGCPHGCLYCYASSYISNFRECRPKQNLLKRLRTDANKLHQGAIIGMSNSSDPYPPMEKELNLTRDCLRILGTKKFRVQVVTKSDLVCRDIDLLVRMPSVVSITITTLNERLATKLEPGAPDSSKRLKAIRKLSDHGIPVSVRVDPIIPGLNDKGMEDLIDAVLKAGAKHITSSTYKARADNLRRMEYHFPKETEALKEMLKRGDCLGGSLYLPKDVRTRLMQQVMNLVMAKGATFSTCREGWPLENHLSCDGSHLFGHS
ncbi:MAG: radical SAM protein [Methanotrichaceae archaeon]|nr:radical SAM protein [Methanotrichaceae archaeon]